MNDLSCINIAENRTSMLTTLPPPPPTKTHRGSLGAKQNSIGADSEISPAHQPLTQSSSVVLVTPMKNCDSPNSSPTESATLSHTSIPHPTDKGWHIFQKDGNWTNFEEHHHLLGNDEENSEKHSSDDEVDIWCITDEQREYYINQFKSMQPDLKRKISGATAKEFFEKSKLPLSELSKIWQLSDVDKDGALSIEEFCTAMHLVVLRRNNIELPEVLPPSLIPKLPTKRISEGDVNNVSNHNATAPQNYAGSPKQTSPSELISPQSKEWTKFNDSPTSSLSSPGMKPVNFDFSAASVEQDPKILHPVALRLSPEKQAAYASNCQVDQTGSHSSILSGNTTEGNVEVTSRTYSNSFSGTSDVSKSGNMANPPNLSHGPKKEPPPPPPPRPKHNHTRSSSLDLNRLGKTVPYFLGAPPAVPPRTSPSTGTTHKVAASSDDQQIGDTIDFADFTSFDDNENSNLQLKSGAFEIYKKPSSLQEGFPVSSSADSDVCLLDQPPSTSAEESALLVDIAQPEVAVEERRNTTTYPPLALAAANMTSVPRDKKELQAAIKAQRERNMMLALLNSELSQELSEIMEERIALEIQLEHLKQFSEF